MQKCIHVCTFDSMLYEICRFFKYDEAPDGSLAYFCVSSRLNGEFEDNATQEEQVGCHWYTVIVQRH
jgi:hypothetical protein